MFLLTTFPSSFSVFLLQTSLSGFALVSGLLAALIRVLETVHVVVLEREVAGVETCLSDNTPEATAIASIDNTQAGEISAYTFHTQRLYCPASVSRLSGPCCVVSIIRSVLC